MNQIVNKYLFAGDTLMPEMHLRQPEFTYSVCGPFTKNKQRIKKFMQAGDTTGDTIVLNMLWHMANTKT